MTTLKMKLKNTHLYNEGSLIKYNQGVYKGANHQFYICIKIFRNDPIIDKEHFITIDLINGDAELTRECSTELRKLLKEFSKEYIMPKKALDSFSYYVTFENALIFKKIFETLKSLSTEAILVLLKEINKSKYKKLNTRVIKTKILIKGLKALG